MFCYNCGGKLMEEANFCSHCGIQQNCAEINTVERQKEKADDKNANVRVPEERKENDIVTYHFLNKYSIHLTRKEVEYLQLWRIYDKVFREGMNSFIEENIENITCFDDIFTTELVRFENGIHAAIDLLLTKLLVPQSIDYIDHDTLWEMTKPRMAELLNEVIIAGNTVKAYKEELSAAAGSGSRWSGGGFGVTGAIKGAVTAELMNVGTDVVGGIFKTLTGNTDGDKMRNLKKKLYQQIHAQGRNIIPQSCYIISMEIFEYCYDVLVKEGRAPAISFDATRAIAKYNNTVMMYQKGEYDTEDVVEALLGCIEINPCNLRYYEEVYAMEPAIRDDLLKIASNNEVLKEHIDVMQQDKKLQRLKEYTNDQTILGDMDMVAFEQDDLDKILSRNKDRDLLVYLVDNIFAISKENKDIFYYGLGEVVISVDSNKIVDFDSLNISFIDISFDERYKGILKINDLFKDGLSLIKSKQYMQGIEKLEIAARGNNDDAKNIIGWMYKEGLGINTDAKKAKEYFDAADDNGIIESALFIGQAYKNGLYGCSPNIQEAYAWFSKKPYQTKILCEIADLYENYIHDEEKAALCYKKAAEQGDYYALYKNAMLSKKVAEALDDIIIAANHNIAEAIYDLGDFTELGMMGLQEEYENIMIQAISYYKKAAAINYGPALYRLGMIYFEGDHVIKSERIAVDYFEKAVAVGNVEAMVELGVCYANGEGVRQNCEKALDLYKKAANSGNSEAQYNIGMCYYYGIGVDKDEEISKKWYLTAAEHGSREAKEALQKQFDIQSTQ